MFGAKRIAAIAALVAQLVFGAAFAQTPTAFTPNTKIDSAAVNAAFATKQDYGGPIKSTTTLTGTQAGPINVNQINCISQVNMGMSSSTAAWCLAIKNTANSGALTGSAGGINIEVDLTAPSGNATGGYYIPVGMLARATSGDGGTHTALTVTAGAAATALTVASIAGVKNGDFLQVILDTGIPFSTVVNGTPSGSIINVAPALPSQATSGNAIYDPKGVLQGAICQSEADAGAVNLAGNIGCTVAAYSVTGSSFYKKAGLTIEKDIPDQVHAQKWDEMLNLTAQSGGVDRSDYGIIVDEQSGDFPLNATSTVLKVGGASATTYTIANGVDLSSVNVTGYALRWFNSAGTFSFSGDGIGTLGRLLSLSGPSVQLQFRDTDGACTVPGALQRFTNDGTHLIWQVNTAGACDFSTGINAISVSALGAVVLNNVIQTPPMVVAALPSCASGSKGNRSFVSDATATTFLSAVAGSGSNNVPVVCDGTSWKIG